MENKKISPKWITDLSIKDLESTPKDELLNYLEILDEILVLIKLDIKKYKTHGLILLSEHRKLKVKKTRKQIKRILKNNKEEIREIQHPFKDDETYQLFNYIVEKWDYQNDIKYAYIFNFLEVNFKSDFERYVRKRFDFKGLFNYSNANSIKNYNTLEILKSSFIENYR